MLKVLKNKCVSFVKLFLTLFTKFSSGFSMKIQWQLHIFPCRLKEWIIFKFRMTKLVFLSLFYNSFMSCSYITETLMEPMFWIVDHFTKYLGPIFVTLVVVLTTSVVTVVYVCFFPHAYYQSAIMWTAIHVTTSHWLLLNIVFNYVMAAVTDPGIPSQHVPEVVSICKKCISPKPPRCHHCSVCNRCILKMDHHCPWLNNCIGFYNHRYFLLFCIYMTLGTIYTSMLGYDLFKQHFYGEKDLAFPGVFYPLNAAYDLISKINSTKHESNPVVSASNLLDTSETEKITFKDQFYHNAVVFNFILCSGVAVALGCLSLYHAYIISKGETSIEVHINSKERKRKKKKGQVFRNPYNFGFRENWRIFLGLTDIWSVWKILFPSIYRPEGNGLTWRKNFGTFTVNEKILQVL